MHASRESNRYAQGSRLGARRVPRIRLETYNFLPKEFLRTFSSNVQKHFERLLGCHDRRAIIAGGTLTHPIHEFLPVAGKETAPLSVLEYKVHDATDFVDGCIGKRLYANKCNRANTGL